MCIILNLSYAALLFHVKSKLANKLFYILDFCVVKLPLKLRYEEFAVLFILAHSFYIIYNSFRIKKEIRLFHLN